MTISRVCTVGNCWQWANSTMGPNGQNHYFAELRQKGMFMHTRGSVYNLCYYSSLRRDVLGFNWTAGCIHGI